MVFYSRADFFQNPEVLAIVIGVLLFVILYFILVQRRVFGGHAGVAIVVSLIVSLIAGRQLYYNEFYGWESVLVIVVYLAVVLVFLRIGWAFVRGMRRR